MDERSHETVSGVITAIIFKNEQNGYTVARARQPDDSEIVIVGVMPFLGCGEEIEASGVYQTHNQYGSQFQVQAYVRTMPQDLTGIYEYLASRAVKGVGPKTAQLIVDSFGREAFDILESHPEQLSSLKGITAQKAREIQASFLRQNAMARLIEFLSSYGLPVHQAAALSELLGPQAVEILRDNPFILCNPPFEVDFSAADRVARDLGFEETSPFRLDAALMYELSWNLQNGHTFIPRGKLLDATAQLCGGEIDTLETRLEVLTQQGRAVCERLGETEAVYQWQAHSQESFVARDIARLCSMKLVAAPSAGNLMAAIEAEQDMVYDPLQREAVLQCLSRGVSLITGGPGTGKTTALKACVRLLESVGLRVALAAPTGRAAKAMTALCGKEAKTIHRLLEAGFDERGTMVFLRNPTNPLTADVVIVDEASMIDLFLAGSLLRAFKPHTRLVLVGDSDQLPPIGAGSFFGDLLAVLPHVRLTEIFRQARGSDIVMNAHAVNRGEMPVLRKNDRDFFFVSTRSPDSTVSTLITLITERIPARFGIEQNDIQVICQSRQTLCGTVSLNQVLQQALNPPSNLKGEVRWGNVTFRAGDRVMQVRNNYDRIWRLVGAEVSEEDAEREPGSFGRLGTGIYNGDIGSILHVDRAGGILVVGFDDRESEYTLDQLDELEHAFAITTHKAQGSEYEAVLMPVFSAPQRLLSRNLLYTGITRAKRHLTMVGREGMVATMIENNRQNRRYGALRTRLRRELAHAE